MGRLTGWLFGAALALAPAAAYASPFAPPPDLRTTLVLRFFGEISDARASFTNVTPATESPLRDAAFVVSIDRGAVAVAQRSTARPRVVARAADPSYVAPRMAIFTAGSPVTLGQSRTQPPNLAISSAYEAASPSLFESDATTSTFSFSSAPTTVPATSLAASFGTSALPLEQNLQLPLALRVGNLHVIAGFDAGLSAAPSSGIDNTLPVYVPAYAGVSRSSLGANLAVPVAPRLLLGVGYNTERLVTGYGMPSELDGLDARNDTYTGNLTFLFPRLGSALSLSAQQYRYQDNLIPAEFTQLREDLNLTVKF